MPLQDERKRKAEEPSEFLDALKKGAVVGLVALAVALPATYLLKQHRAAQQQPPVAMQTQPAPQAPAPQAAQPAPQPAEQAPQVAQAGKPAPRLADFNGRSLSPEATMIANWVAYTHDNKKHAFVIIDKKQAHSYVFGPDAKLIGDAPVLLGKAIGDESPPDIGTRPLSQVKENEKTTPAGRFVAEPGVNTQGEDIIWVSYDMAVSMHRIRKVSEAEHRYERLASPTIKDNRISFGCINNPVQYYETVLSPTVKKYGAIVYVLPDRKDVRQLFNAFDPTDPQQVAQAQVRQRS